MGLIEDKIKDAKKRYEEQYVALCATPDFIKEHLGHYGSGTYFVKDLEFEEFVNLIDPVLGDLRLGHYYMQDGNTIAICYNYKNVQIVFFVKNPLRVINEFLMVDCDIAEVERTQLKDYSLKCRHA